MVPPIFESLRYYDRDSESKNEKIFYTVKGKKYDQKEILKMLSDDYVKLDTKMCREKKTELFKTNFIRNRHITK